jgi:hypothetical protein
VRVHVARKSRKSEVIISACGSIKNCIKSVFEGELLCEEKLYQLHKINYSIEYKATMGTRNPSVVES